MAKDLLGNMLLGSFATGMKLAGGMMKGAAQVGSSLVTGHMNRRRLQQVSKANGVNRGVTEYLPTPLENLFDSTRPIGNMVVSGGDTELRARTLLFQVLCAAIQELPVVILHESNRMLEQVARDTFAGSGRLEVVQPSQPVLEPFLGLRDQEIAKLVFQSIPASYRVKPVAKDYLEGMAAYLRVQVGEPSLAMFLKCPHRDLFAIVDTAERDGRLDPREGAKIRSLLASGQSERPGIEAWLDALQGEVSPILARNTKVPGRVSPVTAVLQHCVLMVDIVTQTNENLLQLLVQQLRRLMAAGGRMLLVLDGISLRQHESLRQLVLSGADMCRTLVGGEDVHALFGGEEKDFATLLGNSRSVFLYRQASALSSQRWAEAFGQYEKQEISTSFGQTKSHEGWFSLFPNRGSNETVNLTNKRDFIIKPEEIQRMGPGEAYVTMAGAGEIMHLHVQM